MEVQDEPRPIPAYYCSYLLRSTVRHASLYIGSTPNPIRRLPQHNGTAKGGAKRTARDKLRPWEMVLVVEGFMSRVGALQFEWAWQHPDRSRHIELDSDAMRASQSKAVGSPKTKKTKPRASGSRRSLKAHLEDLHSLLRSTYFAAWPLRVRFFSADVYRVWRLWNERVDTSLPDSKIILDGDCPKQGREKDAVGSIQNLSVDYTNLESYLEKSMFLLDDVDDLRCEICQAPVAPDLQQIVVCSRPLCRGANHLCCLSTTFLEAGRKNDNLVPTEGTCPTCKEVVSWAVMMREMTLRNRADKEVRTILRRKEKRHRKDAAESPTSKKSKTIAARARLSSTEPLSTSPSKRAEDMTCSLQHDDPQLDDDWLETVDLESDADYGDRQRSRSPQPTSRLEMVIEDSEWDDAELVE
ncbi:Structure-specific endonuclease subunit slx1 [Penicillium hispanicum]|uniref:Structure-specific endonuclease subunit slx1 n=1 Tax=Penicillium hispanicum TaxID=1080232 RepID=UPI002540C64F|nr:Structure-specific endonuclease subunit slx1 [Penicillium hispanicum]KAJ5573789.1 Structure-specific endonuclease subunit slx1 [Penicillium hispanicum]